MVRLAYIFASAWAWESVCDVVQHQRMHTAGVGISVLKEDGDGVDGAKGLHATRRNKKGTGGEQFPAAPGTSHGEEGRLK